MTAVYNNIPQLPPRRPARAVHFGNPTPLNPYAAGRSYREAVNDGLNTFAAGRAYVQSVQDSPTPSTAPRRPVYGSTTTSTASPRPPPLPRRQTPALSAPPLKKGAGEDYFGLGTFRPARQAESAPLERLPRLGGPKNDDLGSLLNAFLKLPPLTVTIEARFKYDGGSSYWFALQDRSLDFIKTVKYEPRQYVDGIAPPQCISAAFVQQKVHVKHHQFVQAEKKKNQDKQSALHMYGAQQIDLWEKKIRVRAEIDYPRRFASLGSRQRGDGTKTFKVIDATTVWDIFPQIPNLPSNFNGNRQNPYVKR